MENFDCQKYPSLIALRQEKYGPIIDQLQLIIEEGFEPRFGKVLQSFLFQFFDYAAPYTCHKIFLGSSLISLCSCILLIIINIYTSLNLIGYINRILFFGAIMALLYLLSNVCYTASKKTENTRYIQTFRDKVIRRKKTPLEEEFLPDFNVDIIEYKIANLAVFPEADLKYVRMCFEDQEKLSTRSSQYAKKL